MNSKHYACIFLATYVALFVLVFSLVEIKSRPKTETPKETVYIALVEPEKQLPEPKIEQKEPISNATPKPNPKPKPKAKDTSSHDKPAEKEKSQETKGQAEKPRTIDPRTQFPGITGGVDKPIASGNKTQQDSENRNSGKKYGLNETGKDNSDEGPESNRKLKGDYLPKPDINQIKQEGFVRVKVIIDKKGEVTAAMVVGGGIHDSTTKNAIIEAAKKAVFEESAAYVEDVIVEYHCTQSGVNIKVIK